MCRGHPCPYTRTHTHKATLNFIYIFLISTSSLLFLFSVFGFRSFSSSLRSDVYLTSVDVFTAPRSAFAVAHKFCYVSVLVLVCVCVSVCARVHEGQRRMSSVLRYPLETGSLTEPFLIVCYNYGYSFSLGFHLCGMSFSSLWS